MKTTYFGIYQSDNNDPYIEEKESVEDLYKDVPKVALITYFTTAKEAENFLKTL